MEYLQCGVQWRNWPFLNFARSVELPFIPILRAQRKTRKRARCNSVRREKIGGCFGEIYTVVAMAECTTTDEEVRMELTAADIPGAELGEPLEGHGVPALKWWLTCRGINQAIVP